MSIASHGLNDFFKFTVVRTEVGVNGINEIPMAEEEKIGADNTSEEFQESKKDKVTESLNSKAENLENEAKDQVPDVFKDQGGEQQVFEEEDNNVSSEALEVSDTETTGESQEEVTELGGAKKGEAIDLKNESTEIDEEAYKTETVEQVSAVETSQETSTGESEDSEQVADTSKVDVEETVSSPVEDKGIEKVSNQTDKAQAKSEPEKKPAVKLHSEEDLHEKDHHDEEDDDDHEETPDYSHYTKEQLVDVIKELSKSDNIIKADRVAREIKPYFDEIRGKERSEALKRFVADGGEEKDFDFKFDELTNRFDANFKLIRDRKTQHVKEREHQKEENLKKKEDILERLREFVDADDPNFNFDDFKAFQDEWKSVGPVPPSYARTLWANYNALVDRFYDHRNIYFELKELDRKKNLELKIELCERAEKLSGLDSVKDAIKELNELHHEFKHIGPVPKEEQEPLWERFKAASDAVYDNRKDFVEKLKKELEANLVVKEKLAEEVQAYVNFDSDRIKEWNNKTKDLLAIQKRWEAVGGLPRARAKEINRRFWGAFKAFFHNKSGFFKKLDAQREGNLDLKKELVKRAEELKDSTDWNKTADDFKRLQREWKEIGPVPEKFRESIYQEFKKSCDHFFDQRRSHQGDAEKEYVENYNQKIGVCEELETMAKEKSNDIDKFRQLQDDFSAIGFVPRKNISEIKKRYANAVDKFISSLEGISEDEKQQLKIEDQIHKIASGPNAGQRIYRKEQSLRKQIGQVENDIAVWRNNMEFFADSSKASKLKDEFQSKIDSAKSELANLKKQLKILRTVT